MRIGILRATTLAATVALAALAGGALAPAASATAPATKVTGGSTAVTTAPGLVTSLLGKQIVVFAAPASGNKISHVDGDLRLTYAFKVTGGTFDGTVNQGLVDHSGRLVFLNLANGKSVVLSRIQLNRTGSDLRAQIGRTDTTQVPIFDVAFGAATTTVSGRTTTITGAPATLTQFAADSLNEGLGLPTEAFFAGDSFGTITSSITTAG
jgi:hypothetical protein